MMMSAEPVKKRSQTLYLVDDDDDLRFTLGLALRDAGFEVQEFPSASAAFAAAQAVADAIDAAWQERDPDKARLAALKALR